MVGLDEVNDYYDSSLKEARLDILRRRAAFTFHRVDIADREAMAGVAVRHPEVTHIIHLAAQAGVRYSLVNPYAYTRSNVEGHLVMLEFARRLQRCEHFVYASSSSVYGANTKLPFSVEDRVDSPVSLYAATKKADELMAHSYSHLFGIPTTGLRFFTVYGPWGRPDMSHFLFVKAILAGRADQGLQRRRHAPRLHLYRRHRERRARRSSTARRRTGDAVPPLQYRQPSRRSR